MFVPVTLLGSLISHLISIDLWEADTRSSSGGVGMSVDRDRKEMNGSNSSDDDEMGVCTKGRMIRQEER